MTHYIQTTERWHGSFTCPKCERSIRTIYRVTVDEGWGCRSCLKLKSLAEKRTEPYKSMPDAELHRLLDTPGVPVDHLRSVIIEVTWRHWKEWLSVERTSKLYGRKAKSKDVIND